MTKLISRAWQDGHDAGLNGINQTNMPKVPEDWDQWEAGKRKGQEHALVREFATEKLRKFLQLRLPSFLLTLDEFASLRAKDQGICAAMQSPWKDSEIRGVNPFTKHSANWQEFEKGLEVGRQLSNLKIYK